MIWPKPGLMRNLAPPRSPNGARTVKFTLQVNERSSAFEMKMKICRPHTPTLTPSGRKYSPLMRSAHTITTLGLPLDDKLIAFAIISPPYYHRRPR
jgi:hypothetical protein